MTATSTSTSAEATIGDEVRRAAEGIALPSGADQPDTDTVMASMCLLRTNLREITSVAELLFCAVRLDFPTVPAHRGDPDHINHSAMRSVFVCFLPRQPQAETPTPWTSSASSLLCRQKVGSDVEAASAPYGFATHHESEAACSAPCPLRQGRSKCLAAATATTC